MLIERVYSIYGTRVHFNRLNNECCTSYKPWPPYYWLNMNVPIHVSHMLALHGGHESSKTQYYLFKLQRALMIVVHIMRYMDQSKLYSNIIFSLYSWVSVFFIKNYNRLTSHVHCLHTYSVSASNDIVTSTQPFLF